MKKPSSSKWSRETLLMVAGFVVIAVELINAEILGRTFHPYFLVLGGALCGVSITQRWDRR